MGIKLIFILVVFYMCKMSQMVQPDSISKFIEQNTSPDYIKWLHFR